MIINIIQIFILFIVPVFLIYKKVIPFKYKIPILGVVSFAVSMIVMFEKWNLVEIGFPRELTYNYYLAYLIFTLLIGFFLILFAKFQGRKIFKYWWKDKHFLFGFIVVSVLQEFIFRSFLVQKLGEIVDITIVVILVNSILYAFMHLIYSDDYKIIVLVFVGGIAFTAIYIYYPSLILISISHMILNFIIVLFGYFSKERLNTVKF